MRVALDVMGGDFGPPVIVGGALKAARELKPAPELVLYGDRAGVEDVLREAGEPVDRFEIVHTTQSIDMHDAPAAAVRGKKDSPIVRALADLKAGDVTAVVSAGSTGAMVAGSLLLVGRLEGVQRPAIATWFPSESGGCVVLDVGANSDNKPEHLVQFGVMGTCFAQALLKVDKPRVGLLNIGEESSKGSELYVRAHALLAQAPVDFVGNVESTAMMKGAADVIVCDGFIGNVVLKLAESMIRFTRSSLMQEIRSGALTAKLGALLMKPAFRGLARQLDYAAHGGAPLLGIDGSVIISHGKSNALAIMNAIRTAARFQEFHTLENMVELLRQARGESIGA